MYQRYLLTFVFGLNFYSYYLKPTAATSTQIPVTRDWLIEFHRKIEPNEVKRIAKRYGMVSKGSVLNDQKLYHLVDLKPIHHRRRRDTTQEQFIQRHKLVKQAIHQVGYERAKRGYRSLEDLKSTYPDYEPPTDPYFQYQWYLRNEGQAGGKKRLDLNVEEAWAMGYTGKNVTTAIMDDGVDYTHPDLMNNFNAAASYDFSSNDHYPYPRYTDDWFNSHGTRCAGEIAASRDNNICGVGVAYDSTVA
ncbi:unnamed protein product, partial [Didymodactylos carnosus]